LHDAVSFFDKMAKDLYSWNIMMSTYNRAQDGGAKVLALFDQMQQEAAIPNAFILASIISACTTHGDVRPGLLQEHA
jgi:pentatricopeptide repeat protein